MAGLPQRPAFVVHTLDAVAHEVTASELQRAAASVCGAMTACVGTWGEVTPNKRIKLARRSADVVTGSRRARSSSEVRRWSGRTTSPVSCTELSHGVGCVRVQALDRGSCLTGYADVAMSPLTRVT
jgi:hypothetical protein